MADQKIYEGVIAGINVSQEECERVSAILKPLADVLMELPELDLVDVTAGICLTFCLRFDEPELAMQALVRLVLKHLPEALTFREKIGRPD
jgi:hypothetical protein